MRVDKATSLLAKTKVLSALSSDILERLGARAIERAYEHGQLIFQQGDPGDSLLVVTQGRVKVFVTSEDAGKMVLVTLSPPDSFGELALIDGGPRSASAESLEASTLLVLPRSSLLDTLADEPVLAKALLESLGDTVRRLTEQAADLVFLDLNGRVAKLLLSLTNSRGDGELEASVLDLHLTQTDLAHMVGGSRQSINEILHVFQRQGYLRLEGRRIVLDRPDLLRRRAGL